MDGLWRSSFFLPFLFSFDIFTFHLHGHIILFFPQFYAFAKDVLAFSEPYFWNFASKFTSASMGARYLGLFSWWEKSNNVLWSTYLLVVSNFGSTSCCIRMNCACCSEMTDMKNFLTIDCDIRAVAHPVIRLRSSKIPSQYRGILTGGHTYSLPRGLYLSYCELCSLLAALPSRRHRHHNKYTVHKSPKTVTDTASLSFASVHYLQSHMSRENWMFVLY